MEQGRIVCILGKKRFGKTTKLRSLALEWIAAHPGSPVLIHDARGSAPDCIGALAPPSARFRDAADFHRRGVREGKLVSTVNSFYYCAPEEVCIVALWYVRRCIPALLVIDELDRMRPILQPGEPAYQCIHYGARGGLSILGSARRPQNVDKGWLDQADELYLFHLATPQALRHIREIGTVQGLQAFRVVPRLGPYQYVKLEP